MPNGDDRRDDAFLAVGEPQHAASAMGRHILTNGFWERSGTEQGSRDVNTTCNAL